MRLLTFTACGVPVGREDPHSPRVIEIDAARLFLGLVPLRMMYDCASPPQRTDWPVVCHDPSAAVPDCMMLPRQAESWGWGWGGTTHQSHGQRRCPLCGTSVSEKVPRGMAVPGNGFLFSSVGR